MKKSMIIVLVGLAVSLSAFGETQTLSRDVIPPALDKLVTVADFASFSDCINGNGASNKRVISRGHLNPRGLTTASADVPATGILNGTGRPTTCVATEYIAHN